MKSLNNKKGFSLSEVLISIGVIGILGVVLIPIMQKSMTNKNAIMFRKSYSTLTSTIDDLLTDDVNYPSVLTGTDSNNQTVNRYFNYTTTTTNKIGTTEYSKFCYLFISKLNYITGGPTVTCPLNTAAGYFGFPPTITSDGISWLMYMPYADANVESTYTSQNYIWALTPNPTNAIKIIIDVNGVEKGPNCAADTAFGSSSPIAYNLYRTTPPAFKSCISTNIANNPCQKKPDLFMVRVRYDGKLSIGSGYDDGDGDDISDACATSILLNPTNNSQ